MLTDLIRAAGQRLLDWAAARDIRAARDTRTDDEIRANPQPGDWMMCSCGYRSPVLADLEAHCLTEQHGLMDDDSNANPDTEGTTET